MGRLIAFFVVMLGVAGGAAAETSLVTRVGVVPMTAPEVIADQDVLIRDGVVVAIGPSGTLEAGDDVARIDGAGGYLMPGLAEMHAHLGDYPGDATGRTLDLFVANGVTTARSMLGDASHLALREAAARGQVLSPRIIASGPSFNGQTVRSAAAARARVTAQANAGYDFLKLHPGLTRPVFEALAARAGERGIPFAGHVSRDVGLELALARGMATIDHLDGYLPALVDEPDPEKSRFFGLGLGSDVDFERIGALAGRTADAGVWNVPTQTLIENVAGPESVERMLERDEYDYVSEAQLTDWVARVRSTREAIPAPTLQKTVDARRRLIVALTRSGAGVLLGSDAPQILNVPGFSLHRELGLYVEAGLSPFEALATGTRDVGVFLGEPATTGVIAVDARADLLLLNRNPLDDITATRDIRAVAVAGRWLDRSALDSLLARHRR
ncbi:MAG: amidohydrolase family protein [Pseudomonadota bacterium]